MNQDLLRIIDGICRDKNIDRDSFVADLEVAMASAIRKNYETAEDAVVKLDLMSGDIHATVGGQPIDMQLLGRIAAQTAKQVIIQKTRERERASIFEDFTERRGTIVTGTVVRNEGGNLLVNIGRTEGFLPRSEQIPGETHQIGERIRVLILEVREQPNQVKVILSRSHPEFIVRLFELEVPEVADRIIELKALAREAGYRTKIAVSSIDAKVDAVGACVGVRGSRIKNIVEELGGEKVDIVRWNESSQILIQNALKPAEVQEVALCFELGKATVVVAEDQLSLAIGKRGQNVRLASRLTNWDIDILTPEEQHKNLDVMVQALKKIEGVDDVVLDKLIAIGCVSVADVDEVGSEPLVKEFQLDPVLAERICEVAGEESIHQEELREAEQKAKVERVAAEAAQAEAAAEATPAEESAFQAELPAETVVAEVLSEADLVLEAAPDEAPPPMDDTPAVAADRAEPVVDQGADDMSVGLFTASPNPAASSDDGTTNGVEPEMSPGSRNAV